MGGEPSQSYNWPAVNGKGWVSFHGCVSFHPWEGNPLINGNPKVVQFNTHFSESKNFHTRGLAQQSLLKVGYHFIE